MASKLMEAYSKWESAKENAESEVEREKRIWTEYIHGFARRFWDWCRVYDLNTVDLKFDFDALTFSWGERSPVDLLDMERYCECWRLAALGRSPSEPIGPCDEAGGEKPLMEGYSCKYDQVVCDLRDWFEERMMVLKGRYGRVSRLLTPNWRRLIDAALIVWLTEKNYELSHMQTNVAFFDAAKRLHILDGEKG